MYRSTHRAGTLGNDVWPSIVWLHPTKTLSIGDVWCCQECPMESMTKQDNHPRWSREVTRKSSKLGPVPLGSI